jgi:Flp pilus assembly protein TadB
VTHNAPTLPSSDSVAEALDVTAGVGILLLPLLTIALPGVLLLLVVPVAALILAASVPVLVAGAILVPPYLVVRAVLRLLRR